MSTTENLVTSIAELEALYDAPGWAALAKETDSLIAPYRAFVEAAPYLTIATIGTDGVDCSPRGDAAGFVRIVDAKTLLIPNRNGNNRIESLRNIIRDPRVAIHFLVPGCGESLRVKGRAAISADPALTASFAVEGKSPRTLIVVTVERAYFHCGKAIQRSKLWDPSQHVDRRSLPSVNAMLAAIQWQRCRNVIGLGTEAKPIDLNDACTAGASEAL
jgi:PPOX class probable FMN-dependent enzyme